MLFGLHCKVWITPEIKLLISQGQKAFTFSNRADREDKKLGNKTIRVISQAKSKFCESMVLEFSWLFFKTSV